MSASVESESSLSISTCLGVGCHMSESGFSFLYLVFFFQVRFSVAFLFKPDDWPSTPIKLKTFSRVVASLQLLLISNGVDEQNCIAKFKSENICNSEKIVCNRTNKNFFLSQTHTFSILSFQKGKKRFGL